MNKRIVDGTGVWKSDKIARIEPQRIRAEYANWIPLALANGSFEADTRRIWATVYSYNRPDISLEDAEEIRKEFFRVGLLFLWSDEATGKVWGYFTGIEKPGRLPAASRLKLKHEPVGPNPPVDVLRSYVELTRSKALDAAMANQWLANGYRGFGFGLGFGLGSGTGESVKAQTLSEPPAPGVCDRLLAFWNEQRGPLPEVLKLTKDRRAKILARVKADPQFPESFETAVRKARVTPFLCGSGERGWKATFDWLIANDKNAVRVVEGSYDDGKGGLSNAEQRTLNNLKAGGFVQ